MTCSLDFRVRHSKAKADNMPVDHPVPLAPATALPRYVRLRAALLGFGVTLAGLYALNLATNFTGLLS